MLSIGVVDSLPNYLICHLACSESSQEASTSGREQDAILVGTVELSFTQSTRASYLTLNAPAVSREHDNWAFNLPALQAHIM